MRQRPHVPNFVGINVPIKEMGLVLRRLVASLCLARNAKSSTTLVFNQDPLLINILNIIKQSCNIVRRHECMDFNG